MLGRSKRRRDPVADARAQSAFRHAEDLADRASGASDAIPKKAQDVQPHYRGVARLYDAAREAMLVAADALEEAGDGNAAYAREFAQRLARRATDLRRVRFLLSKTYETWTEEDRELGEASDSGYEFHDVPATAEEVLHEIRRESWEEAQHHGNLLRLYSADSHVDYRTGEDTSYALHIRGEPRALRRLHQLIEESPRRGRR